MATVRDKEYNVGLGRVFPGGAADKLHLILKAENWPLGLATWKLLGTLREQSRSKRLIGVCSGEKKM